MKNLLVFSFGLVLLAGCNTLSSSRSNVGDPRPYLMDAAVDRDVRTIIVGNPLLITKSVAEQKVTAELNLSYKYLRTNFTVGNSTKFQEPYKVVFAFNPSKFTDEMDICAQPHQLKFKPAGSGLSITAVFCMDEPISYVSGIVDLSDTDKVANLNDMIRQLAYRLVPQEDPLRSYTSD